MFKRLTIFGYFVGIYCFTAQIQCAEQNGKLNASTRKELIKRYEEINSEENKKPLSIDEKIKLFTEAQEIANKILIAEQILLNAHNTNSDYKKLSTFNQVKLENHRKQMIANWQQNVNNTQTILRTLNRDKLLEEKKAQEQEFLQKSNLLDEDGTKVLQKYHATIHGLHTICEENAQKNATNEAQQFADQYGQQSALLTLFNKQMDRASRTYAEQKKEITEKNQEINKLQQEVEQLKKMNAFIAQCQQEEKTKKEESTTLSSPVSATETTSKSSYQENPPTPNQENCTIL